MRFPGVLRTVVRQRLPLSGLVIVLGFSVIALLVPRMGLQDPLEMNAPNRLAPPSWVHWLGTDEFGRDVLSRVAHGTRISFSVGFVSAALGAALGVPMGLCAGYFGGAVDRIFMGVTDVLFAFPAILLSVALVAMMGPTLGNVMIALAVIVTPTFARVVRGAVLIIKNTPYVEAAVALGVRHLGVMVRHILPNAAGPMLVQVFLSFSYGVLVEASLSFLGLGTRPPTPSWGSMLNSAYGYMERAPWFSIFPGLAIVLTVLGFNFLGDGLRDATDPVLRRSRQIGLL